jgi:hypothetical protein
LIFFNECAPRIFHEEESSYIHCSQWKLHKEEKEKKNTNKSKESQTKSATEAEQLGNCRGTSRDDTRS